jgi:hypothetical protein
MANQDQQEESQNRVPRFIQKRLDNPPVIAGESPVQFRIMFGELECVCLENGGTAAEYIMVYEVAVLTWRLMRVESLRVSIIRHHRPQAVLALIRRSGENGEPEQGSLAHVRTGLEAMTYFASKDVRQKVETKFAEAGYAEDAVEVEAYLQSQKAQVQIERETAAARRQLLEFLKEIERRSVKSAKQLREAALKAVKSATKAS